MDTKTDYTVAVVVVVVVGVTVKHRKRTIVAFSNYHKKSDPLSVTF